MNDSESERQAAEHFVVVPQREGVMRHECDLRAFDRGDCRAADERILISVAAGNAPLRRHKAIQSEFVTVCTLTAGLQDSRRIVWISRSRVGPILPVKRCRERQIATDVPLGAEFVIRELLGFDLLRDGRQL